MARKQMSPYTASLRHRPEKNNGYHTPRKNPDAIKAKTCLDNPKHQESFCNIIAAHFNLLQVL